MRNNRGAPHDAYFAELQRALRDARVAEPAMVLDFDRLDRNAERVRASLPAGCALRLVAKSLPSPELLAHLMDALGTRRQMVFHAPFIAPALRAHIEVDVLLGKPLPVAAANRVLDSLSDAETRRVRWLVDDLERLHGYLALGARMGRTLRLAFELDVGLHRGGFGSMEALDAALRLLSSRPTDGAFAGALGYDAHLGKLPAALGLQRRALRQSQRAFRAFRTYIEAHLAPAARADAVWDGAGSPTFRLHGADTPLDEVAIGSAFVKPLEFDVPSLADLEPAAFIAAPVLKALDGLRIPQLEMLSTLVARVDPNLARTYFLYGGRWPAVPVSPVGLRGNRLFGESFNQAVLNGSRATHLAVDDTVFFRPLQSESIMLQLGAPVVVRGGRVIARWSVLG